MQSESRKEKRRGQLLVALHLAGLAVLAGACLLDTSGGADRHARSSVAAPVAGAGPHDLAPAAAPDRRGSRARG